MPGSRVNATPVPLSSPRLPNTIATTLTADNGEHLVGNSGRILGNPFLALLALANAQPLGAGGLQKGQIVPGTPTLTRVHQLSLFDDMLGRPGPRKRTLQRAMAEVGKAGAGIILLLVSPDEVRNDPSRAPEMDLRSYGIGAQILGDLGVHDMILLTNAHRNLVALDGYGLNVVGERPIPAETT